jgi:hypothetical protein
MAPSEGDAMQPAVRLFGTDRAEIEDLDGWLQHAPPEKGEAQWRDGYSAKEQAKAWLRGGSPAMPEELWAALSDLFEGEADEIYARPEHKTKLDNYGRARQHDLLACVRRDGAMILVAGIEAKACEDFAGSVGDRATAAAPSNKRARCNLLSRALFGREVFNEESGDVIDAALSRHGYQLWTATVGHDHRGSGTRPEGSGGNCAAVQALQHRGHQACRRLAGLVIRARRERRGL